MEKFASWYFPALLVSLSLSDHLKELISTKLSFKICVILLPLLCGSGTVAGCDLLHVHAQVAGLPAAGACFMCAGAHATDVTSSQPDTPAGIRLPAGRLRPVHASAYTNKGTSLLSSRVA